MTMHFSNKARRNMTLVLLVTSVILVVFLLRLSVELLVSVHPLFLFTSLTVVCLLLIITVSARYLRQLVLHEKLSQLIEELLGEHTEYSFFTDLRSHVGVSKNAGDFWVGVSSVDVPYLTAFTVIKNTITITQRHPVLYKEAPGFYGKAGNSKSEVESVKWVYKKNNGMHQLITAVESELSSWTPTP